jgi:hypothetical protein
MSTDDTNPAPQSRQPRAAIEVVDGVKHYRPSFTPRAKHPCIELKVNLRTETAYRVFQSVYDPVQKVFYHLYATLPIACRDDRKVLDAAQKEVETELQKISQEIDDELERCKVKLKNEGADPIKRYYNDEPMAVEVLTPMMSRFVGAIIRMDQALVAIDTVFMADVGMTENEHTQTMKKWRNRITRFNRAIAMVHMRVMGDADRQAHAAAKAASESSAPAKPVKKVLAGKDKQKQQRRPGKVVVKVPVQAKAAPEAEAEAANTASSQAVPSPAVELVEAAA